METNNGLIIYESKYGATRDYAQWLKQELKLHVLAANDTDEADIKNMDFLIIGTPVYAGQFRIKNWLKKYTKTICSKKIFLFVVCNTGADEQQVREQLVRNNIPPEIKQFCEVYFLPGKLEPSKLSLMDKLVVKMVSFSEKNENKKREIRLGFNNVRKDHLIPLIKSVLSYYSAKPVTPSEKTKYNSNVQI